MAADRRARSPVWLPRPPRWSPACPGCCPRRCWPGPGAGIATPLGFAALAASAPPGRLGQTTGAAGVGRELGDAGGPILVAAAATVPTLPVGLRTLAGLLAAAGTAISRASP